MLRYVVHVNERTLMLINLLTKEKLRSRLNYVASRLFSNFACWRSSVLPIFQCQGGFTMIIGLVTCHRHKNASKTRNERGQKIPEGTFHLMCDLCAASAHKETTTDTILLAANVNVFSK